MLGQFGRFASLISWPVVVMKVILTQMIVAFVSASYVVGFRLWCTMIDRSAFTDVSELAACGRVSLWFRHYDSMADLVLSISRQ